MGRSWEGSLKSTFWHYYTDPSGCTKIKDHIQSILQMLTHHTVFCTIKCILRDTRMKHFYYIFNWTYLINIFTEKFIKDAVRFYKIIEIYQAPDIFLIFFLILVIHICSEILLQLSRCTVPIVLTVLCTNISKRSNSINLTAFC